MRVAIVGAGTIGAAFARLLIEKKKVEAANLFLIEKNEQRSNELRKELGCYASAQAYPNLGEVQALILAVKPQDFPAISASLKKFLRAGQLVISVVAGTSIERIHELLGSDLKVLRAMPNLPMTIGEGVTGLYAEDGVDSATRDQVIDILSVAGKVVPLKNEDLLDAATAISGSGPGYLYYLIEGYMNAALKMGFDPATAKELITHTVSGTMSLYLRSSEEPSVLRERVTSKGGTTQAALDELSAFGVRELLERAIIKAFDRAKELNEFN